MWVGAQGGIRQLAGGRAGSHPPPSALPRVQGWEEPCCRELVAPPTPALSLFSLLLFTVLLLLFLVFIQELAQTHVH